jgi:hypothetical protein
MLQQMDQINPQAKEWIEPLLTKICNECKESVDSIYLYGSVVTKDFVPKQSTIQSLILFDDFHFPRAKQIQPIVKAHIKNGVSAPLCLAVETLEHSTDTFPLEFSEIKEKHLHVFGETNRVKDLVIPTENMRLKIEEQIKGKLIRLREVYMEIGDQPKFLIEIMEKTLHDLVPPLRNMLKFLAVDHPPVSTSEVLKQIDEKTEFSSQALEIIWNHHLQISAIPKSDAVGLYGELADVLLNLSKIIDRWQEKS